MPEIFFAFVEGFSFGHLVVENRSQKQIVEKVSWLKKDAIFQKYIKHAGLIFQALFFLSVSVYVCLDSDILLRMQAVSSGDIIKID